MRKRISTVTVLLAAFLVAIGCKKDGSVEPPAGGDSTSIAGYALLWHDEFDGPSIDTTVWNYEVNGSGGGNNELQYYTHEARNAFIENGALVIQALKESYNGKAYTSARLNSSGTRDWLYGRVDVRARLPEGRGLWPAIWMLPTDWVYGGWPYSGEIDIMELVGHLPGIVYGTVHWGTSTQPHLQLGGSDTLPPGRKFSQGYHLFSLEWTPDSLKWFVDGVRYFSVSSGPPFDKRFHMVLNVAVGGNWPGSPDATTVFPQYMMIDYIRVYAKNA